MKNPLPDIMRTHIIVQKPRPWDTEWTDLMKLFAIIGGMVIGFFLRGLV